MRDQHVGIYMAMKAYVAGSLQKSISLQRASSVEIKYQFRNAGIKQLDRTKCYVLFLSREVEGKRVNRVLSFGMHQGNPNWLKLREALLGSSNPPPSKHTEAANQITEALLTCGGATAVTGVPKGIKSGFEDTFVLKSISSLDADTEALPFSSALSAAGDEFKIARGAVSLINHLFDIKELTEEEKSIALLEELNGGPIDLDAGL